MQTTKRRRMGLDSGYEHLADPSQAYIGQHDNSQYPRNVAMYGSNDDADPARPSGYSLDASSVAAAGHTLRPAGALGATSGTGQDWDAPPYSEVYPDTTAYSQTAQHPYYGGYAKQSTDPSTYNSPWPPQAQSRTESFGAPTSNNYGDSGPNNMPYLGASDNGVLDVNSSYDSVVASNLEGYGQDVDMSVDYVYDAADTAPQAVSAPMDDSSHMVSDDASMQLKNQSLSILDNLAIQLIQTIAKISLPQIQEILAGGELEEGQAYHTLKSLFEQTRKVYSRDTPFIDAVGIQMFQPAQQEIIRKANIATFVSSILGAHDVSFFHLNEFFLETFVPLGHRLLKWQGAIYLDLKTQAYISALINSDGTPSAMLDELFPADLDAQILTRHPDAPTLSPSEQDFIDRCRARKSYLLAEGNAASATRDLPKKYQWTEFVREFASCVSKNVDAIMNNASVRAQNGGIANESSNTHNNNPSAPNPLFAPASSSTANPVPTSAPTATTAPSTVRQPWTKPEEDALLAGLARVQGPHWSQILALYGRGGSVSEVLKDRNQVQLKDKARNLKLWYLKMGQEVPEALRGVTGELRKRGGKGVRERVGAEEAEGSAGDTIVVAGSSAGADAAGGGGGSQRRGKTKKGS